MTQTEFVSELKNVKPYLKGFTYSLTKSQADAEDLLQEGLLRAYKYRGRFQAGTNFKAWVCKIIKNLYISDYNKKKKTFKQIPLESGTEYTLMEMDRAEENRGPGELAYKQIYNYIEEMDSKYSNSFLMHFRGFKYDEIATREGAPLGTIKNRIFVAREKLKSRIQN